MTTKIICSYALSSLTTTQKHRSAYLAKITYPVLASPSCEYFVIRELANISAKNISVTFLFRNVLHGFGCQQLVKTSHGAVIWSWFDL